MKIDTTKVVLTKLRCSWWYGNRTSHDGGQDLAEKNGGEAAAFAVTLKVMPPEVREPMAQVTREMYEAWKCKSLPFEEGGWRIMRASNYDAVAAKLNELAAKRRTIVDWMMANYDTIIAHARRVLGKAYEEGMVPPREQLPEYFRVSLRCKPVPTAGDMRLLNISDEMRKEMEQQLAAQLTEAEGMMKEEVRGRLTHFIRELIDRLNDHKKGSGVRYGALLKSLGKFAKQFREVGLLGQDELLVKIEEIAETSSKDVREDAHIRKAMKRELDAVATAVEDVFA